MIIRSAHALNLVIFALAFPASALAYDDQTTHPALTDEIVDFYNLTSPEDPISNEEKEWIVEGSILEDTPPRWINHFYDPVHGTGWTGNKAGVISPDMVRLFSRIGLSAEKAISSIEWINSYLFQEQYRFYGGNRSWQRGMEYFVTEDKRESYRTLGHILHLLEDLSVPDHTRDDTHAHAVMRVTQDPGSPYEEYARQWDRQAIKKLQISQNLISEAKAPPVLKTAEDYLTSLARYSNANFFSRDTINDPRYSSPIILKEEKGFAYIEHNGDVFPAAAVDYYKDGLGIKKQFSLAGTEDYFPILDAYFSRLSAQTVLHGAGLVRLYLREARDAAVNKEFPKHLVRIDAVKLVIPTFSFAGIIPKFNRGMAAVGSFFREALHALGRWFEEEDRELALLLPGKSQAPSPLIELPEIVVEDPREASDLKMQFATATVPSRSNRVKRVIDGDTIEIEGGEIIRYIGIDSPEIAFGNKESECFSESAKKRNEEMVLGKIVDLEGIDANRDDYGRLLRYVKSEGVFVNEKLVAEGYAKAFNYKNTNVYGDRFKELEKEAQAGKLGMWGIACDIKDMAPRNKKIQESKPTPQCSFAVNRPGENRGVVINEVAWMGAKGRASDEWIELKNINPVPVDISGWEIADKDGQIKLRFQSSTLAPGGFYLLERTSDATVAEQPADAIYVGAISNKNEGLRLFDHSCTLVDEVLAVHGSDGKSWPAGSEDLYRTMERDPDGRGWHTYGGGLFGGIYGTPRAENGIPYAIWFPGGSGGGGGGGVVAGASTIATAGRILISEIQVGGIDSGDEFIELYNAEEFPIDLSAWSIQYLSGGGVSLNVTKKNMNSGMVIDPHGFLLIARNKNASGTDGFAGVTSPDLGQRTISLSGSSAGATIFIVNDNISIETASDPNIVDRLAYGAGRNLQPEGDPAPLPASGQSLERKAFFATSCISATGEGKFLGNGCDTGNNAADFELQPIPLPQSGINLPEPRSGPQIVNLATTYASGTLSINFHWDSVRDARGEFSSHPLSIYFASTSLPDSSSSSSYAARISEVGTQYSYRFVAVDGEGMESETTTTVLVPSFLERMAIYSDPRIGGSRYLLDLAYSTPHFIPRIFSSSSPAAWQAMVFYLNREPNAENMDLATALSHEPLDQDGVLEILYASCSSSAIGTHAGYVFAIESADCGSGGGLNNTATFPLNIEDHRLLIETSSSTSDILLGPSDYVTVAFYDFAHSGGGTQNLFLVAIDKTRYSVQLLPPPQSPPTMPLLQLPDFDETSSELRLAWSTSTDSDSGDRSIRYEIALSTSSALSNADWVDMGTETSVVVPVVYPSAYLIGVRAKDDFDTLSPISIAEWAFPEDYAPLPIQSDHAEWVGTTLGFGQKIFLPSTTTLSGIALWIGPDTGIYSISQTFIELKNDSAGAPGDVLATSAVETVNHFDGGARRMFILPETVLSGGAYYWIIPQRVDGVNKMRLYGSAGDSYSDGFWAGDLSRDIYFQLRRIVE